MTSLRMYKALWGRLLWELKYPLERNNVIFPQLEIWHVIRDTFCHMTCLLWIEESKNIINFMNNTKNIDHQSLKTYSQKIKQINKTLYQIVQ